MDSITLELENDFYATVENSWRTLDGKAYKMGKKESIRGRGEGQRRREREKEMERMHMSKK